MARINVEQQALGDHRFFELGRNLHVGPQLARWVGLGIMIPIWNHLTENWSEQAKDEAYTVDARALDGLRLSHVRGLDLARAITDAGLAEETEVGSGVFRIRGTYGRIEWLNRRREWARINGKKGGRKPTKEPTSVNPLSPAPSLAPARDKRRSEIEVKAARERAPVGSPRAPLPGAVKETEFGSESVPDAERPGRLLTAEEFAAVLPMHQAGLSELQRIARAASEREKAEADAMRHVVEIPELIDEDPAETLRRLAALPWPAPLEKPAEP